MSTPPIILVPGWWLGAWAWDTVADLLRADGHTVTAVTLPGLEPDHPDRGSVTFADHVDAICEAVTVAGEPVVLAVHSGAGYTGYAASDRVHDRIRHLVYVDTAPGIGAADPEFEGAEFPLAATWEELGEDLTGISEEQLATFRERAVPEPGGVLREGAALVDDARLDVPSTVICTAFPSDEVKKAVDEGYSFLAGLKEVRDVAWVDLPTSHWPMWSRPEELAGILGQVVSSDTRA